MTFELALRAAGHLSCVLAFGLFIATMSLATLGAAAQSQQPVCNDRFCMKTMSRSASLGTYGGPMHSVVALLDH